MNDIDWKRRAERAEAHIFQIGQTKLCCPRCGGENGQLGTSNAYYVCPDCRAEGQHAEQYWSDEGDWIDKVMASPWGRPAHLAQEIKRLRARDRDGFADWKQEHYGTIELQPWEANT